jgi:hypothetical protein
MIRTAEVSACQRYRYLLKRQWRASQYAPILWVMLNPSTADDKIDDPTIRRCISFSYQWGFDALLVVNLSAWRATDPRNVPKSRDLARGPEYWSWMEYALHTAGKVVCAWGAHGPAKRPDWLPETDVYCLGRTKSGAPKHPLYVKASATLQLF